MQYNTLLMSTVLPFCMAQFALACDAELDIDLSQDNRVWLDAALELICIDVEVHEYERGQVAQYTSGDDLVTSYTPDEKWAAFTVGARIFVPSDYDARYGDGEKIGMLVHELAHVWYNTMPQDARDFWLDQSQLHTDYVSKYAMTNEREDFAEHARAYFLDTGFNRKTQVMRLFFDRSAHQALGWTL